MSRQRGRTSWRTRASVPLLLALALAACGGDEEPVEEASTEDSSGDEGGSSDDAAFDDAETFELTIGHAASTDQLIHQWAEDWAAAVDDATDGTVTIDLVPDAQLGGELDIVQQVSLGAVDGVITGATGNAQIDATFAPYLFRDGQHMLDVLDGEIAQPWVDSWRDDAGIQVVGFLERSPRQISANRPIENVDDLAGFTIRVPEIDSMVAGFNAAGASPTPLAWPEVYTSLQTGAIDGQENPIEIIGGEQLDEVQDYLILSEHVYTPWAVALNADTYDAMSDAQRDAVHDTFEELRPDHSAALAEEVEEMRVTLEDRGMEVIEPDIDSFRDVMLPAALDHVSDIWGEETAERVAEGS
jgi:TRAP-type transport system periplasmic protein